MTKLFYNGRVTGGVASIAKFIENNPEVRKLLNSSGKRNAVIEFLQKTFENDSNIRPIEIRKSLEEMSRHSNGFFSMDDASALVDILEGNKADKEEDGEEKINE